jgi:hypothetical protein
VASRRGPLGRLVSTPRAPARVGLHTGRETRQRDNRRRDAPLTTRTRTRRTHQEAPRNQSRENAPRKAGSSLSIHPNPVTGAPGWQVITYSRGLALALAGAYPGKASGQGKGEWRVLIHQAVITVTVIRAGTGQLWCQAACPPSPEILVLAFAPWSLADVLGSPLPVVPVRGTMTAGETLIHTRMGRTVRYLIPRFTP